MTRKYRDAAEPLVALSNFLLVLVGMLSGLFCVRAAILSIVSVVLAAMGRHTLADTKPDFGGGEHGRSLGLMSSSSYSSLQLIDVKLSNTETVGCVRLASRSQLCT